MSRHCAEGREPMLAPDQPRGTSEIADDIFELLSDVKAQNVKNTQADQATEYILIASDVQATIRTLRTIVETGKPVWGYGKENVAALEAVSDTIKELQSALRTMPSRAWLLLFAKELITGDDLPAAQIQQEAASRTRAISGLLAGMLARCSALIAARPGKHKGADWVQQLCSDWTWDFLLRHNKRPTGANSADSLLRGVARLFYEGVTGKDVDLEHACRKTFERRKQKKSKRKKH
jgi:hypothetical protein